jgi:tetratricopeptide (TPR) repeat protein
LEDLERRLVAIPSADVVGYSRLMADDEIDITPVYPPIWPAILAQSYLASGHYAEASAAADAVLAFDPEIVDAHLVRIGAEMALGRTDAAARSAEAVRRVEPNFRVDAYGETQPYRDPADLERVLEALRGAGLH